MNRSQLTTWLRERVASLAAIRADDVDDQLEFDAYGIDSAKIAELLGDLEQKLQRRIGFETIYANPRVASLLDALTAGAADSGAGPDAPADAGAEPIAIVGAACRLPAAPDLPSFWQMLVEGRCGVGPVPASRWESDGWWSEDPGRPGRSVSRSGGFIDQIDGFDYGFFGIAAAEAVRMDPQQRIMLEVAWDALEDAGAPPHTLRGSETGVFVGASVAEYGAWQLRDPSGIDGLTATGGALSIVANRISYYLDLHGPSLAVDSACSSSLVAVHLARQALLAGECSAAIAGGVNAVLSPEIGVSMSKAGVLSPGGLCRSFDAAADGYVRSEGGAAVVLKRLSDAEAAGDRILALIIGSAVNQDGRSNGLVAPNPAAQTAVIRSALRTARVGGDAVGYVEAHGSATALGDRMEAAALSAGLGAERAVAEPCRIGSVKTNLGHLEAAAGIAGLLKAALSVHHGMVPASLHVTEPNPTIDFEGLGLEVVREGWSWERPASERIAGVSSFGFGGTNAHTVLRGYERSGGHAASAPRRRNREALLVLSAHDPNALRERAHRWAAWLERTNPAVDDVVATAASRTRHELAIAVVGGSPAELAAELRDAAQRIGAAASDVQGRRIGFVFSGQGPSWNGSAAELFETYPLFASVIRRVDEEGQRLGRPRDWLVDPVRGRFEAPVNDQAWMQPAWFAVQVGLASIWRAAGVRPACVLGHSLGEVAAVHVAGSLDLAAAARVACIRGTLAAEMMAGQGGLVATDLTQGEALAEIADASGELELAAINGPRSTTLAGGEGALAALVQRMEARGRFARRLPLAPPSHSQLARKAADRLGELLADLPARPPTIPTFSSVTAERFAERAPDGVYWRDNLCLPVRFSDAAAALLEEVDAVVEIGPQPAAARSLREVAEAERLAGDVVVSSNSLGPTRRALLEAAAELVESGVEVEPHRLQEVGGRRLLAPGTAWQRARAWRDPRGLGSSVSSDHTLLGEPLRVAALDDLRVWEARPREETLASTTDHRIAGEIVVPAAAFIDALFVAAESVGRGPGIELRDLHLERFLRPTRPGTRLQTSLRSIADGERVEIHACAEGSPWQRHASASLHTCGGVTGPEWEELAAVANESVDVEELYGEFARRGVVYGPAHQSLQRVSRGRGVAVGVLRGSHVSATDPARLDGAFQLVAAAVGVGGANEPKMAFPVAVKAVRKWGSQAPVRAAARVIRESGAEMLADVWLYGPDGRLTTAVEGLLLRSSTEGVLGAQSSQSVWSYEVAWREVALDPAAKASPRRWIVLGEEGPSDRVAAALSEREALDVVTGRLLDGGRVESRSGELVELEKLLGAGNGQPIGVLLVAARGDAAPETDPGVRGPGLSRTALELIRSLSFAPLTQPPRLVFLTSGAVGVRRGTQGVDDPASAVLRGLARVVPFENALLECRLLDAGTDDLEAPGHVADELQRGDSADVALRDGVRYVSRLVPVTSSFLDGESLELDPAGAYVITGGTGGIGLGLGRHLVKRGAQRLALIARSGPTPEAERAIDELRTAGARVLMIRADVAVAAELSAALEDVRQQLGPIRGVAHAAGTLIDRAMLDLDERDLTAVLRPKVAGGWNLHRAVANDELDWFVCFSSAAGTLGSPGQSAYCAANAFLDALAAHRVVHAGVATSIDWGPWSRVGMVAGRVAAGGERAPATSAGLEPATAFSLLDALLVEQPRQRVILPYDLADLLSYHPGGPSLEFFHEILEGRADLASTAGARKTLRRRPRLGHDPVPARTPLESRILAIWQAALGIEQLGITDGFFELGGDSVLANQVFMAVNREFGVSIEVEAAFPDATVANLATLVEQARVDTAS